MITICLHEEIKRKIAHILAAIYLINKRRSFFLVGKQGEHEPYAIRHKFIPYKIGYEIQTVELYQGGIIKRNMLESKTVFCDEKDIITFVIEVIVCCNSYLSGKREIAVAKPDVDFSLLKRIIRRIKEPDSLYFDPKCLEIYAPVKMNFESDTLYEKEQQS